ncbi:hypothetical protein KIW84_043398 [Lathyrus oleraceus]|uniref:Uncharacterized protein n=1 Tax=Pisum sativum TaxID=3888 RepID=A0A9D4XHC2_PEA|nr:hypothetical protein KIW84_043398 [Pisum sativum]
MEMVMNDCVVNLEIGEKWWRLIILTTLRKKDADKVEVENEMETGLSTRWRQDNNLIADVIPNLITGDINNLLTLLLSSEEIHNAVFALSPNNALGPDGLEGEFVLSIRRSSRMIWLILC